MKLDLGSWSLNLKVESGGGTPSWGTALGQGKGYDYSFPDQEEYLAAMEKCSVPTNDTRIPLGKGGKKQDQYIITKAALFKKIYVHLEGTKKEILDSQFVLLEVVQLFGYHCGRKFIKYNKNISYKEKKLNLSCIHKIEKECNITPSDGWFVSEIEFSNDDELHIYVHILKDRQSFKDSPERKQIMGSMTFCKVSHYTSIESAIAILMGIEDGKIMFRATRYDCLNDPNECRYGEMMWKRIFGTSLPNNKPFILSFCNISDNPIMWRLYESKVQFVFNRYEIENEIDTKMNGGNSPNVIYKYGDVIYIDQRNINSKTGLKRRLHFAQSKRIGNDLIAIIKHRDYVVEDEWRIIAVETQNYSQPDMSNDLRKIVGASSRYGLLKLHRVIPVPLASLKEIIIYEFDNIKFDLIKSQMEDLLKRKNISGVNIKQTECSGCRK